MIKNLVELLSFLMLIMGVFLSTARTVQEMLPYYRIQCLILSIVTVFTAVELRQDNNQVIILSLFVTVPMLLAYLIEPLLAQATVPQALTVWQRLWRAISLRRRASLRQEAIPAWLRSRRATRSALFYLVIDLVLIALAYTTAYVLVSNNGVAGSAALAKPMPGGINPNVLAVSFSLLLIGLLTMMGTEDLISQVIGLLTMEQGMFLAVVRAVIFSFAPQIFSVRIIFVVALFLYISVTLIILVFLLPEMHQKSVSLDIEQQTQLKG
jgi:hydrogenase-4 membrane subunit HyfE